MEQFATRITPQVLRFDAADVEVRARMAGSAMTIEIVKAGARVHQLTIGDAGAPMEYGWLADLFAREDYIELSALEHDVDDYVGGLNINQG